jgi:hypothetical protein
MASAAGCQLGSSKREFLLNCYRLSELTLFDRLNDASRMFHNIRFAALGSI